MTIEPKPPRSQPTPLSPSSQSNDQHELTNRLTAQEVRYRLYQEPSSGASIVPQATYQPSKLNLDEVLKVFEPLLYDMPAYPGNEHFEQLMLQLYGPAWLRLRDEAQTLIKPFLRFRPETETIRLHSTEFAVHMQVEIQLWLTDVHACLRCLLKVGAFDSPMPPLHWKTEPDGVEADWYAQLQSRLQDEIAPATALVMSMPAGHELADLLYAINPVYGETVTNSPKTYNVDAASEALRKWAAELSYAPRADPAGCTLSWLERTLEKCAVMAHASKTSDRPRLRAYEGSSLRWTKAGSVKYPGASMLSYVHNPSV